MLGVGVGVDFRRCVWCVCVCRLVSVRVCLYGGGVSCCLSSRLVESDAAQDPHAPSVRCLVNPLITDIA